MPRGRVFGRDAIKVSSGTERCLRGAFQGLAGDFGSENGFLTGKTPGPALSSRQAERLLHTRASGSPADGYGRPYPLHRVPVPGRAVAACSSGGARLSPAAASGGP